MEKITKILAPTDLSELSEAGVRYALNLAKAVGAEVTVYNVVSSEELMRYGERMKDRIIGDASLSAPASVLEKYQVALGAFLEQHFSDAMPGVEVHEKVEIGTPEINIVEQAKKEESDLIVISTHGRSGLTHILLGSVTEKVVRRAPCPVLSIRPAKEQAAVQKSIAA
ncbi:MAG: universal stress protein [Deltaproteobacteria bacterium]|nr:universal stress protein [Deltaproteobacteria bacterium]MBI2539297.1 universal stress protein [Deltaproteobacteria bacterium]